MFGSKWKAEVLAKLHQLEQASSELKRAEAELRSQNARLNQVVRSLGRKLVMRLPISIESLEKGLTYDLIFPEELETWAKLVKDGVIIDVRAAQDFSKGSIPSSRNIPSEQLGQKVESLQKSQPVMLVCENGMRSIAAAEFLSSRGFPYLYVLKGGLSNWRSLGEEERLVETSA